MTTTNEIDKHVWDYINEEISSSKLFELVSPHDAVAAMAMEIQKRLNPRVCDCGAVNYDGDTKCYLCNHELQPMRKTDNQRPAILLDEERKTPC